MAQFTGYDLGKRLSRKIKSGIKGAGAGGALGFGALGPSGIIPGAITGAGAGVLGAGQVVKPAVEAVKTAAADTPAETIQSPKYSPEQQQRVDEVMRLLLNMGTENIQNPYAGFEPIAQNTYNDFFENIVPEIQETYAGSSAYSSPALHTALSGAGASLAERLAAMQSEYGMQNRQSGLQQLQLGLNPTTENYFQPSSPGFGRNLLNNAPALITALAQLRQNNQTSNLLKQLQLSR